MANYTSPMQRRIFLQRQPNLSSVANTSGIWSSTGAQYIPVEANALNLSPNEPKTALNFVHGSPASLGSIQGRKSASWSLNAPIFPNGVQAVAPDTDLLWQSVFGGPGFLATGTVFGNAWVYGHTDFASVPLTILSFSHGQTVTASEYIIGALVERCTLNFNTDILAMSVSGPAVAEGDVETFSVLDAEAKGGLTAFPVEPSSFAYNGQAVHGYGGTLSYQVGSGSFTPMSKMCNGFTVDITTGVGMPNDAVDTLYPYATLFGPRAASGAMTFLNNDDAVLSDLKAIARTNEKISVQFVLGSIPGQRMGVVLHGLQLVTPTMRDNSNSVTIDFGSAMASVDPGGSEDVSIFFG
jgi:hypothetical protein